MVTVHDQSEPSIPEAQNGAEIATTTITAAVTRSTPRRTLADRGPAAKSAASRPASILPTERVTSCCTPNMTPASPK